MNNGKKCETCQNADGKRLVVRLENFVKNCSGVFRSHQLKAK